MKKLFLLLMLFCVLLLFSACGEKTPDGTENPSDQENTGQTELSTENPVYQDIGIVVDTDYVNVRITPSMDGRIINTALRGTIFSVLTTGILDDAENEWIEVLCYGDKAYISADYLYHTAWDEKEPVMIATITEANTPVYGDPEGETVLYYAGKYEQLIVEEENQSTGYYKVFDTQYSAYVAFDSVSVEEGSLTDLLQ